MPSQFQPEQEPTIIEDENLQSIPHSREEVVHEYDQKLYEVDPRAHDTPTDPSTITETMPSLDETVIPPKEHRDSKLMPWYKKPAAKGAGALLALGIAGGTGAVLATGNDAPEATTATTEAPTVTPTSENQSPVDSPGTQPEGQLQTDATTVKEHGGHILLDSTPGPNGIIEAQRPDGSSISVPALNTETNYTLANTFLELLACYDTTGDEACLNEITQNMSASSADSVRTNRDSFRNREIIPRQADKPSFQELIFDNPDDPVLLSETSQNDDGMSFVQLTSGTLYLAYNSASGWQDLGTLSTRLQSVNFETLKFDVRTNQQTGDRELVNVAFSTSS